MCPVCALCVPCVCPVCALYVPCVCPVCALCVCCVLNPPYPCFCSYVTLTTFISTRSGRLALLTYLSTMHILCFVSLLFLVRDVDHGCDLNIDHLKHVT
jgi:hypothetical protein